MSVIYDLAILGCGPAGLSAAINAIIRNKLVIVLGTDICSPPLHKAQRIDNYLGFYEMKGNVLLNTFMEHANRMGVEITPRKAEMIYETEGVYNILLGNDVLMTKTIIIATGIPYKPTLPKEDFFLGKGLGYCATCDGPIYKGKDVMLIAHSNEAESEADFMTEICNQVYYLPLYKMTNYLNPQIEIIEGKPEAIIGDEFVEGLRLIGDREINVDALFILGGETAPERLIPGLAIEDKHIKVNRKQETNLKGVYAAGDCTGTPYQVAKSVGEGQVAGLNASIYAAKIK